MAAAHDNEDHMLNLQQRPPREQGSTARNNAGSNPRITAIAG